MMTVLTTLTFRFSFCFCLFDTIFHHNGSVVRLLFTSPDMYLRRLLVLPSSCVFAKGNLRHHPSPIVHPVARAGAGCSEGLISCSFCFCMAQVSEGMKNSRVRYAGKESDALRLLHEFFDHFESSPSSSFLPAQLRHLILGHVKLATQIHLAGAMRHVRSVKRKVASDTRLFLVNIVIVRFNRNRTFIYCKQRRLSVL